MKRRGAPLVAGAVVLLAALLIAAGAARPSWVIAAVRRAAIVASGARSGTVRVRGVDIAWLEQGRGPVVVLVHGLGGESFTMLPLARALAAHGYRVLAFDLPGYGRSGRAPDPLTIESAGEFVLDAAQQLGAGERPALLGHSIGGWVVAWQALAHPDRCGPVILAGAAGLDFEPPPLNILMPRTVADGRQNLQRLFARPPWIPAPVLWVIVHRPRPANLDLLRSALSGEFLLDGLLAGMTEPTLLVWGAEDRIVPPDVGARMAQQTPGARLVVLPGAGHMLTWERPREVAALVDQFLREHAHAE